MARTSLPPAYHDLDHKAIRDHMGEKCEDEWSDCIGS